MRFCGFSFARPAPVSRRLFDYWTYLPLAWSMDYTYRLRHFRRSRDRPVYLGSPYRDAVLRDGITILRRLFRLDRLVDQAQYGESSRRNMLWFFDSRVRVDF
jgi:hypothetical protein